MTYCLTDVCSDIPSSSNSQPLAHPLLQLRPSLNVAFLSRRIQCKWAKTIVWANLHWIRRERNATFELSLTVFVCPQVVILFLSHQVIYHSFPWLITSCFFLKITSMVSSPVVQRGFFSWVFFSMDLRWSTHQAKSVAKTTAQMFGTFGNSNIWNK